MSEAELENWLQKSIDQLDICGMYSKDKPKVIRLQISVFFLIFFNLASILDIVNNCNTLEKYIEGFTTFLPSSASLVFLYCFVCNRHTLHEVVGILRKHFILHTYSMKAEIMGIRLVKYSQYYLYFVFSVYLLLSAQSYLEKEGGNIYDAKGNGLPARSYIPINMTKTYNFALILFVQLLTIIIVIHITIPIAMCFAALLIHLRAQLFYLQECLIQVCEHDDPVMQRTLLKRCLELHMLLIHFTEKMQSAFGSILSIHNYSPSIVISVVGYQASMMSVLDPKFLPYMSTVNYVLAECFVYCYYGQHIIDQEWNGVYGKDYGCGRGESAVSRMFYVINRFQSELLGFIAYSNKWYNCSPDIGNDLNMIIMRCQKPLQMKFVGSTSASLETYYNIVKTGYSYFMFLASMGAPNEM